MWAWPRWGGSTSGWDATGILGRSVGRSLRWAGLHCVGGARNDRRGVAWVEPRKGLEQWQPRAAGTCSVGSPEWGSEDSGPWGLMGGAVAQQRWTTLGGGPRAGLVGVRRRALGRGCSRSLYATPGLACNGSFDMYVCWDYAAPNTTARASCPWYLPWHRHGEVSPELWAFLDIDSS